jgi:hypothetical protein
MQISEMARYLGDHDSDLFGKPDVAGNCYYLFVIRVDGTRYFLSISSIYVDNRHSSASLSESVRQSFTYSLAGAGHKGGSTI